MGLTQDLKELLFKNGAKLAGIGDLKGISEDGCGTGVSIAVPVPKDIIIDLQNAPTKEYYDMYEALNNKLNEIAAAGERFLRRKGFEAYAQTTDRVKIYSGRNTKIPHKTVATRAGLGWIGKNGLLVTDTYGSAVRLSSLLTDAPLEHDSPMNKSLCGSCSICVKNCPAGALRGTLWEAGMPREEIVDVESCYEKQIEIMYRATGIKTDLCGKCFAVCRYTQKYMRSDYSAVS